MMNSKTIIQTRNLSVYYGTHRGIKDINLSVQKGEIFGFLGPNGAGKTTTQRVILDIIHPTKGSAFVFGLDSRKDGIAVRRHISYLPGELSLYPSMRASSFFDLLGSLQNNGLNKSYLRQLLERLELDPNRKIKEHSHGNKQKIGVAAAFMGEKDLIILDEPTIGLDPLAQQTVLELVQEVKEDGRTVFFSSHNLKEVQEVCDRVGIIQNGELIKTEKVETLTKQQFKRLEITFRKEPSPDALAMKGVKEISRDGNQILFEVAEGLDQLMEKAVTYGVIDIENKAVSLEEIFLAFYGRSKKEAKND
ncbi:MAG: ATP-binding cassette domain-containing protein [Candidatus Aminicenantes bacterium]|nr:ATP-binding cassette domain-containing protein [Candidatus Aminicenantes bacterium]